MDANLKWLTDPAVFRVNRLDVRYFGMEGRPELPLFGLRFAAPVPLERVEWVGLSGETYPDRKKGGIFGTYSAAPRIADYLVPQECGCHMDTHQMILRLAGLALTIQKAGKPFAFSVIPYTPQQLSEAFHADELPVPCRTVVTLCGAVRGVGGMDSWGANVEEAYRVSAEKDIGFSFRFRL